jgi:MFS family permease
LGADKQGSNAGIDGRIADFSGAREISCAAMNPVGMEAHAWRAWAGWGLVAFLFGLGYALRISPSVMVGELMRDFSVGAAVLGNLTAIYFYVYAAMQLPVGWLTDRFGARRLACLAGLLLALGSAIFAASPVIGVAYLGRALIGFGSSFLWIATLSLAAQWFGPARFTLMTGLSQLAGTLGAMGGQGPLALAVDWFGWRGTAYGAAMLCGMTAAVIWLVVRDRPVSTAAVPVASFAAVLSRPQVWLAALVGALSSSSLLAFGSLWMVPFLTAVHGMERTSAAWLAAVVFLLYGCAGPLVGWLATLFGRRKPVLALGQLVVAASMLAALFAPPGGLAVVIPALLAFSIGAAGYLVSFALAREHAPEGGSATALALVNGTIMGGGALLQPLIGWLLDLQWDGNVADGARVYGAVAFRNACLILPLLSLVGLALLRALREPPAPQPAAAARAAA